MTSLPLSELLYKSIYMKDEEDIFYFYIFLINCKLIHECITTDKNQKSPKPGEQEVKILDIFFSLPNAH